VLSHRGWPGCRKLRLELLEDRRLLSIDLVSSALAGSGNGTSHDPSISSDGRYVAFTSAASNLVVGDTGGIRDIFVKDFQTGSTIRVSVDNSGDGGNGGCDGSSISSDGRYVAFHSDASDLVTPDTNGHYNDTFVRDVQAGATTLVSTASDGTQGEPWSHWPSITSDGRYVAFCSEVSTLVAGETNGDIVDVFVKDRQTGTTTRVSTHTNGTQGNGNSLAPSISSDGRYVAFYSAASNLVAGDTNGVTDIFVKDRQTGTTTRVSTDSNGMQGNGSCSVSDNFTNASISGNGRYVAFYSAASNLVAGDTNGKADIFVKDLQTGTTTRVSTHSAGTQGNGDSEHPSISGDARYVAFASSASNLVAGDTNGKADIFVKDVLTGITTRVSVPNAVTQANGDCYEPSISSDGRYVTFASEASNLHPDDTTTISDVFRFRWGAGVNVSAISGNTTEAGGTATFTVTLNTQPTSNVTIPLSSSDPTEGTVAPSVTITPAQWSTGVVVTATGVDDVLSDGNITYWLVTGDPTSADANYNGLTAEQVADVPVTNIDNETPGINVSAISGNTTEAGGTATFTVTLNSQPTADVTIPLSSSDPTEGTVAPSVTITPAQWSTGVVVTVTGVNDFIIDGDIAYAIVTGDPASADANYDALTAGDVANMTVTNFDNDTAGINVSAMSGNGNTSEGGGTRTFRITLTSQPSAEVTIPLSSSDLTEGTAAPSVTITPAQWNTGVVVTVTGVDDVVIDGNIAYTIVTGDPISSDAAYNVLTAAQVADVSVTNIDNETPGINVSAISGNTTEAGGTATFTVTLNSQPTADVTIPLSSSDPTEGTVASSVTITAAQWNTDVVVTVTGVDDVVIDGNIAYTIVTGDPTSADADYNALTAAQVADVSVTNTNNETAGINVSAISGSTTEAGGTATFTVTLNSQPTADVTIPLSSSDLTEGTVSGSVTITPAEWNTGVVVTVTGVDDMVGDGDIAYAIVTDDPTSTDADYEALTAGDVGDVAVTNVNDDLTASAGGPYSGQEGIAILLDASGSFNVGGAIISYAWDLDNDGQYDDAVGVTTTFSTTVDGIYTIGVCVTNDNAVSDTDSTTVTINNVSPTADAGGPYTVDEGSNLTLTAAASADPGNDISFYAWDLDNDGEYDDATGVTAVFNRVLDGSYMVRVQAIDDDGASGTDTATVTVINAAPMAEAGGPYTAQEGIAISLNGWGSTDPGNDIVLYEWDLDNDGQYDDAVGVIATFSSPLAGIFTVGLRVTDNDGAQGTDTATVAVCNYPPVADAGGSYAGGEGSDVILDASASTDPDNDITLYEWDLDNDGQYDDATGVTATFNSVLDGVFTIGLRVGDSRGLWGTDTTTVTLNNVAPTANPGGPYTGPSGSTLLLDASFSTDPGNDIVLYEWDLDNDGQYDDATGRVVAVFAGNFTVRLRVTDANGAWDTDVTTVNNATAADAGGPYVAAEGSNVILNAANSIATLHAIVAYEWDLDNDGQFDDATGVTVAFNSIADGVFTIRLRVTDDADTTNVDTTFVTVNNVAPTPSAGGPYSDDVGAVIVVSAAASTDPGQDITSYAWDLDNDGQFDDGTAVTANFNGTTPGRFTIRVRVTDNDGGANIGTTTVTVDNDTVGLYNPTTGAFYLRNHNNAGNGDWAFRYGPAGLGWQPIVGDWNNDGIDTVGLYDPTTGVFYLKNTNGPGAADVAFQYGAGGLGWQPIVGDWNNDGADTVGVYIPDSGAVYLRNSNSAGNADVAFGYGPGGLGWQPVVGDWDNNGTDTIGIYDPANAVFYLRNSNSYGVSDIGFAYGPPGSGWLPMAGNWDATGADTIGLYNAAGGTYFLRNANESGIADEMFGYGPAGLGWQTLICDWDDTGGLLRAAAGDCPDFRGARRENGTVPLRPDAALTDADLQPIVSQAVADWASAGVAVGLLESLDFIIADLPGSQLGRATRDTIFLDIDAAGHGWFIDPTPGADEEFQSVGNRLEALDPQAVDRIDLLTVVSHELGHAFGLEDVVPSLDGLMSGALEPGVRREPRSEEIDVLFARLAR
jgi:Tol biopolymer transport system component